MKRKSGLLQEQRLYHQISLLVTKLEAEQGQEEEQEQQEQQDLEQEQELQEQEEAEWVEEEVTL